MADLYSREQYFRSVKIYKDVTVFDIEARYWQGLNELDVEQCWHIIKDTLHKLMDKHIPKIKSETNSKGKKPKWITRKVQKIINKKNNLYRKYIISKKQYDLSRYIKCRNESDAEVRKTKSQFEKQIAKDCKSNPKFFWKYVQEKSKQTTGISPLDKGDGVFVNDDIDKADVLNAFFSSVFTREDTNNVPEAKEGTESKNIYLTDIVITPRIKDKLKQLNNCTAQGPDGIPPRVLKEVSENLAIPLSILFNKSLEKGLIPADWKQAEVVAVFKKGTKSDPGNYRPVSLTSVICKILESFVRDAIVKHMNDHNLYANCQHCFGNKRSFATQLLEVMEILTDHIDQREPTDMVYLDFRKAFDSVPHERLLSKLMMYGITGGVHSWVKSLLYDRTQRVRVGKKFSSSADVLGGIPQGSIHGPVLFTIFINDIADNTTQQNDYPRPTPTADSSDETRYPCGACDISVKWDQRAVACESCGQWFHLHCQDPDMNSTEYEDLGKSDAIWHCVVCANANYSSVAYDLFGLNTSQNVSRTHSTSSFSSVFGFQW